MNNILKFSFAFFVLYFTAQFTGARESSWNISCSKLAKEETLECTMQQKVVMKNSQLPVLQLTLAQLKKKCGNLDKVKGCVKLTGYVNSTENFIDQPKVINAASDLISNVFGDAGKHTRAAVSVNSLPLGAAVEVDAIFEL